MTDTSSRAPTERSTSSRATMPPKAIDRPEISNRGRAFMLEMEIGTGRRATRSPPSLELRGVAVPVRQLHVLAILRLDHEEPVRALAPVRAEGHAPHHLAVPVLDGLPPGGANIAGSARVNDDTSVGRKPNLAISRTISAPCRGVA